MRKGGHTPTGSTPAKAPTPPKGARSGVQQPAVSVPAKVLGEVLDAWDNLADLLGASVVYSGGAEERVANAIENLRPFLGGPRL